MGRFCYPQLPISWKTTILSGSTQVSPSFQFGIRLTDIVYYPQTKANGKTKHGFPFSMEYIFTFTFEDHQILSANKFLDASIVQSVLTKETIAAQACPAWYASL